jgi:class 3 adenylate cyclase/tetratricopeptide (TPR) repeat protein
MAGPAAPNGAERKLVTVLFVDVDEAVDDFAERDPEDVGQMLAGHLARVRAEVEAFGGVVEETVGGRTVAVFGVPRTRDDDPERAVLAALAVRDALAPPPPGAPPSTRAVRVHAAVATGEALVRGGHGGPAAQRVLGDPVSACARLQEAAPAGAVLVASATRTATERAIAYAASWPAGGEPAWTALARRDRIAAELRADDGPFPPLVARTAELRVLLDALGRARRHGVPQLVTVVGVAGIGKTRLLAELAARLAAERQPVVWRQGRSLPWGHGPAFGALAEAVKAEAGIVETDGAGRRGRRLADAVADAVNDPATAAWVTGHLRRLVGAEPGEPPPTADREEEFAAWRRFLHGLAAARPLVLGLEDLHRADDALLDFVESLARPPPDPSRPTGAPPWGSPPPVGATGPDRLPAGPSWGSPDPSGGGGLLVVATARPELLERRPGWGSAGVSVRLEPLGDADTTELLAALLAHHGLPATVEPGLLARVGGNPLFAEEYVRMLRDHGGLAAVHRAAPPTGVHAIVAARLDALPPDEKAVLRDAAVLGQVGWVGALGALGGGPARRLQACLARLEAKEFVQRAERSRVAGEVEYSFRHALVRDVAYGQVLRAERADKHRRAAGWLERLPPDRAEDRAELLAYHYRAALGFARAAGAEPPGLADLARAALREAGDRADGLGGYETATRFFAEALELCPDGDPDRGRLLLRLGRARCRGEMRGHDDLAAASEALLLAGEPVAAAEAEMLLGELAFLQGRGGERAARLDRALALVADAPPSASKAAVLRGAMMHLLVASRHAEARAVGRQVVAMAGALGLRDLGADALGAIGTARVEAGDASGMADLEAAIATFQELGTPGGIVWHLNLAWAAAALGDLPRCFAAFAAAAAMAERFGSLRHRRSIELQRVAERYWAGRWDEAVAIVDALVAGAERHYLEWECRLWRGRIRLARGRLADALEDAETAVALASEAGDPQDLQPTRAFLARVLLAAGRRPAAAAVAAELLAGLGGGVLGPDLGVDLGVVLRGLDEPASVLHGRDIPPSPWLEAARALVAGDPAGAAAVYAAVGSRPDEADARLAAARRLAADGRVEAASAELAAARAFWTEVGAAGFLAETAAPPRG